MIAEDHHPGGGLGSPVTDALIGAGSSGLRVRRLGVRGLPGSGSGAELMAWAGIDADHIADAAPDLISSTCSPFVQAAPYLAHFDFHRTSVI
jgi:transketolase